MTGSLHDHSDDVAVLRPRGTSRYFEGALLAVWLTAWLAGELFVAGALVSVLLAWGGLFAGSQVAAHGRSLAATGFPTAFLALVLWLTLWTVGGAAAGWYLLRRMAGRDRIAVVAGGVRLTRQAGPLRRTYRFERVSLRRIRIRHGDRALVADTPAGTCLITDLGTAAERESLCSRLRDRLKIDATQLAANLSIAPPGWRLARDATGAFRLSQPSTVRRAASGILWGITAVAASMWVDDSSDRFRHASATTLVALFGLASTWMTWAREEWVVRSGRISHWLRFGPMGRERRFENGSLEVTSQTDSEGDFFHRLVVRDSVKHRTFASSVEEDVQLRDCARWLAAASGFAIKGQEPAQSIR